MVLMQCEIYNFKCLIKIISIKLNRDNYQFEVMNRVSMEITAWPDGLRCISFMILSTTISYLRIPSTLMSSFTARTIKRRSYRLISIRCLILSNSSQRIQLLATRAIPLILINRTWRRKVLQRARKELNSKQ